MRSWTRLFTAIAVGPFGVAIYFGNQQPFVQTATGAATSDLLAGLAAFGFALAGGSLIAAAIVRDRRELANKRSGQVVAVVAVHKTSD